jgi:hypothetical protein
MLKIEPFRFLYHKYVPNMSPEEEGDKDYF